MKRIEYKYNFIIRIIPKSQLIYKKKTNVHLMGTDNKNLELND